MTRVFDAPRHLVWGMALTRPELIKRWLFSPPGWSMTACEEDLKVAAVFRWAWAGPDGKLAMSMHGVYREGHATKTGWERWSRRPHRDLRDRLRCSGRRAARHARPHEKAGKTLLTLTVRYPSKEARDATIASGMEQGVSAGYDRLEELLQTTTSR